MTKITILEMAPDADLTAPILLLKALSIIKTSHYILALSTFLAVFLYNFLEFHFLRDLLRGFRGDRVLLTFNPSSKLYQGVVSRCRILHERYVATPWLASPHFQTAFLNIFGRPPAFCYTRQLYIVRDGGTIALDWLLASDVLGGSRDTVKVISEDDSTPLVIVVPGLTSDSASAYIKHLVHRMAKQGWNVVVGNHRGLGGISITSDCFYNAGWTEDVRELVNYLHQEYSKAPLFAVGTSIGANILVKYLGEEGKNTPLAGATAICSPWDFVICDRFINRKLVQRLYDRALAVSLRGYAQIHQSALTRLANWDGIQSSRSVRDFNNHATCLVAKFETVDAYYRHCNSVSFVEGVSVPLLCISALDDPVCTSEAIPWDECRANKNIVLATLPHGGHLAFFKGITAHSLWWVGAVSEFLSILYCSPYMHGQKQMENSGVHSSLDSSIDESPYININEDGLISAVKGDNKETIAPADTQTANNLKPANNNEAVEHGEDETQASSGMLNEDIISNNFNDLTAQLKRSMNQLSCQSRRPMWLLSYIAIVTTWPLLGSLLRTVFKNKSKGVKLAALSR